MTVLGMPQMSQMGPISKSCLFWVVTWPLGVEVSISWGVTHITRFFIVWAVRRYLKRFRRVKCARELILGLVEPVKARKRKAERVAEQGPQPPSKRAGTVYRWTPAALASYESSTMQGGESADRAPG